MTLQEFAQDREYVVVAYRNVFDDRTHFTPLGYPDLDFVERNGLLTLTGKVNDLTGEVNDKADWRWDGNAEDNPTDDRGTSLISITAFVDEEVWQEIVLDYETEY